MSPMKPVNLLPDVPLNHNARKLTDKEQRDCDVIGRFSEHSPFIVQTDNFTLFCRTSYKIVFLHRTEINSRLRTESNYALFGKFC